MILRQATIKYKGYDPEYLKPKSNKRVCVSCDECGKVRYVNYCAYRDLCLDCKNKKNPPHLGHKHNNKSLKQMKDSHIGLNSGKNHYLYKKNMLLSARIKSSCTRQGIDVDEWNGFLKDQKYCSKFNEILKIKIRNNYNNCDYISGLHKSICNNINNKIYNLDVHHVSYDKEDGCNDKQFNLIPLSKANHAKTNFNKLFWNKLFKYSLEIDKNYYGVI